jgi:DNA-binding IclR family transcriptional regulator
MHAKLSSDACRLAHPNWGAEKINLGVGYPEKTLDIRFYFENYLRSFAPEKMSPFTIVSPQELRKERKRIRTKGYSISNQEVDEGVSAVGACILDAHGFPAAGIAVASLSVKMTPSKAAELGDRLSRVALEISSCIGFKE